MMRLTYGSLYWPTTLTTQPARYPTLDGKANTQVVIVGGGISGVLTGYVLARSGIQTVLIERDRLAAGSTSANTGLLQYSNDIMLTDLAAQIGETEAVRFYRACKYASEQLLEIAQHLPPDIGVRRRNSFYYASSENDVPKLKQEYDLLHRHGFDAEWWDNQMIASHFTHHSAGAIVTHGDAEINPVAFVHALAKDACRHGMKIYEDTALLGVSEQEGRHLVKTDRGDIDAGYVVYAVGYQPEAAGGRWINARARLNRSYAIVTNPLDSLADWPENMLLWETARPYLYFRTTSDRRIIVGGLDEAHRNPQLHGQELELHARRLLTEIKKMFPRIEPEVRYAWCATFGESSDGLPFIGEDPDRPGQFYNLGYGGNGTIYSMLAAHIIRDRLFGLTNTIADIVKPDRTKAVKSEQVERTSR